MPSLIFYFSFGLFCCLPNMGYKSDDQEGVAKEKIVINYLGLLLHQEMEAKNFTKGNELRTKLEVEYALN